jgi:hypothetical protein
MVSKFTSNKNLKVDLKKYIHIDYDEKSPDNSTKSNSSM